MSINCGIVKLASVLVIGALWIPACYTQQTKMVRADESLNGREVDLHVGETLEISLSENASTGFQWIAPPESAHDFEKILQEGKPSVEGTAGPPGKPGVRHFYFEAVKPGTVKLELQYRRAWETAKPPARKFDLRVRVRPASAR